MGLTTPHQKNFFFLNIMKGLCLEDSCEHGNEHTGSMKVLGITDDFSRRAQIRVVRLLKVHIRTYISSKQPVSSKRSRH
jgi:hypothetical protein